MPHPLRLFVSIIAATVVAVLTLAACATGPPTLDFAADTPDDVRRLADETFTEMREAFPARHDCLDGITVATDRDLDERAEYLPDSATVVLRIPATAPQLRRSLVHELGHHLEFVCDAHPTVRPAFLEAGGFEADHSWFEGPTWEETPSEQWASAVVEYVLGDRDPQSGVFLSRETLPLVEDWATDR